MLTALFDFNPWQYIYQIGLMIDGTMYMWISHLYKLFLLIAKVRLMDENDIAPFIRRIYVLIGTVMLFFLAYTMLRNIVEADGGKKTIDGKTIVGVIKTIVLLAVVPTLFDFAYAVQDSILSSGTLSKIIIGTGSEFSSATGKSANDVINSGGNTLTAGIISAFLTSADGCDENTSFATDSTYTLSKALTSIQNYGNITNILKYCSYELADENSVIEYNFFISFAAACVVVYLLLRYNLSLGFRTIKLLFYEMISPIPILLNIVPNKKNDVFSKWISCTLKTYAEIFIRVCLLYLVVFVLALVDQKLDNGTLLSGLSLSGYEKHVVKLVLIIGLLMFLKKGTDILSELFGDVGGGALGPGIRDALKSAMVFQGAAAIGGGLGNVAQSIGARFGGTRADMKKAKDKRAAAQEKYDLAKKNGDSAGMKAASAELHNAKKGINAVKRQRATGVGSILPSLITGASSGFKNAAEANNWSGVRSASKDAITTRQNKRKNRTYTAGERRTRYLGEFQKGEQAGGIVNGITSVAKYRGGEAWKWATGNVTDKEKAAYNYITSYVSDYDKLIGTLLEKRKTDASIRALAGTFDYKGDTLTVSKLKALDSFQFDTGEKLSEISIADLEDLVAKNANRTAKEGEYVLTFDGTKWNNSKILSDGTAGGQDASMAITAYSSILSNYLGQVKKETELRMKDAVSFADAFAGNATYNIIQNVSSISDPTQRANADKINKQYQAIYSALSGLTKEFGAAVSKSKEIRQTVEEAGGFKAVTEHNSKKIASETAKTLKEHMDFAGLGHQMKTLSDSIDKRTVEIEEENRRKERNAAMEGADKK